MHVGGFIEEIINIVLLATFCLQITGCSNNMGTLREKSKTLTTVKSNASIRVVQTYVIVCITLVC